MKHAKHKGVASHGRKKQIKGVRKQISKLSKNEISHKEIMAELKLLKKLHSIDHKQEKRIIKKTKKTEWLHIPTDKEIKAEIAEMERLEKEAQRMLVPEQKKYPKLGKENSRNC